MYKEVGQSEPTGLGLEELNKAHPGKWIGVYRSKFAVGGDADECCRGLGVDKFQAASVSYRNPVGTWILTLCGAGFIAV
jgi:hypothetical protein